jgi:hypothetical protein
MDPSLQNSVEELEFNLKKSFVKSVLAMAVEFLL